MRSSRISLLPMLLLLLLLLASTQASKISGKAKQAKKADCSKLAELEETTGDPNASPVASSSTTPSSASGAIQPSKNGTTSSRQRPCVCAQGVCSCCSRILLNLWKQRACVNVTYDPDEFEFTARISMNDQLFFTRTVSGKNPRPVCVPVPRIPAIRACIRFYNIYFQGRNVHACVNMEGRVSDTTLFKVGMDCIRLGQNGVALVKPEDGGGIGQIELLPSDPGEADSDEDYDDDYDDYDDDDDDLFDY
ncbi:hypothetical protein TKK_0014878 [Trichogramma kaykai]|uniref:DUF4773 domain-containing protein n=1 Tax=Trichogramma kaykai TaxID=54128 RepID=A0ABD2WBE3_9HYME